MIAGVSLVPLKIIADHRGRVMHMLRSDSPGFTGFGEIYFSVVNPGIVKGWKQHQLQTQRFAVPSGNLRIALFDDRQDSVSTGRVQTVDLGEDNYQLLVIPPRIWYAFAAVGPTSAMIANCTDLPHDPAEVNTCPLDDPRIPYRWP